MTPPEREAASTTDTEKPESLDYLKCLVVMHEAKDFKFGIAEFKGNPKSQECRQARDDKFLPLIDCWFGFLGAAWDPSKKSWNDQIPANHLIVTRDFPQGAELLKLVPASYKSQIHLWVLTTVRCEWERKWEAKAYPPRAWIRDTATVENVVKQFLGKPKQEVFEGLYEANVRAEFYSEDGWGPCHNLISFRGRANLFFSQGVLSEYKIDKL